MSDLKLLSRDAFREGVFKRDGYKCVVPGCGAKADDAHHILERRLWLERFEKEGYYLDNGASLCEPHHQFGAELCNLQPQILRKWAGIKQVVIQSIYDPLKEYDKWGVELKQPTRSRIKYPSTPYLHMSPGYDPNDINLPDVKPFLNVPLVVTIKMDGSNTQITSKHVAARNGTHADHPSFDRLKAMHKQLGWDRIIPENLQVFGEWLYAKHSIHYMNETKLEALFQPFGVYDMESRLFGGWEHVEAVAKALGVPTTPVLARGVVYSEEWQLERDLAKYASDTILAGHEGLVVSTMYPFPYGSFEGYETSNGKTSWRVAAIAKYVRPNHVQTDDHWSQQAIVKNEVSLEG